MKKLIPIIIFLVITVASQGPTITQTSQFVVGSTEAHDIKFWGDDIIASRFIFEASSYSYFEELILLNKFGEVIWRQNLPTAHSLQQTQIIIKGEFCIFTVGDSVYKINKAGEVLKKICVPTENASLGAQEQEHDFVFIEGKVNSSQSKFFVYNEELDLIRVIFAQPGATYSVSQLGTVYFVAGGKYGGGVVSNVSCHIAKYDTTGNLLWLKQFPDVVSMHITVSNERLYFCAIDISSSYQKMIYGEIAKESGNTVWLRQWGAPYPETFATVLACVQMHPSPGGGFAVVGLTTAPGQNLDDYEPNLPVGFILGYAPALDHLWTKTTSDFGYFAAGDWRDSSLMVFGNLGSFPNAAAKAIIYSISGLTAIEDDEPGPRSMYLGQNYPNPFNPSTKIKFSLAESGLTSLKVYDLLGREVATLVDEELVAGEYEASFEASSLASGVYIITLSAGRRTQTRKMILVR